MPRFITHDKVISHTIEGKVRFSEVDSMHIVWHGNYLKYFEDAREQFGLHYGMAYLDIYHSGFQTPIVKTEINHKSPLKYGDSFKVKISLHQTIAAKIVYSYEVYNLVTKKLVATGQTIQVFTDGNDELQLLCPAFYEKWFNQINWD